MGQARGVSAPAGGARLAGGASPWPASKKGAGRARLARWGAFFLAALLGLAIRLPQLGARPMHTDEAVNAYMVGQLLDGQAFRYNPQDRHGPALAALALPLARLQGARRFASLTEAELRLTPVLAGTATILLFGAGAEIFGFAPCLVAALLFAADSLPVYYDRYFIHESLFVAVTLALILASWRAGATRSAGHAALAAACAALLLACKETAVLHFAALGGAAGCYWLWHLRRQRLAGRWRPQALLAAAVAFLLVTVLLFTWFGAHWRALAALAQAAPDYLARAGGEGHQKPFRYYAQLLTGGWAGATIVAVACIGVIRAVIERGPSPYGFLAFYAILLTGLYGFIPYKTPWLALNLWLPLALFFGLALTWLFRTARRHLPRRAVLPAFCFLGAVGAALIAHDTRQRVFADAGGETNPYAYAHTSEDLLGLPAEIEESALEDHLASPRIAVIASDPWPLPWYLRRYAQVGYWQPGQPTGKADFYITSTEAAEEYQSQLQGLRPDFFGLRPGVLVILWLPPSP